MPSVVGGNTETVCGKLKSCNRFFKPNFEPLRKPCQVRRLVSSCAVRAVGLFTLLAALMRSVRTAGQKKLTSHLSPMATTMLRYLFGAPFALIYSLLVFTGDLSQGLSVSFSNPSFLVYALLASITQIAATVCLVKVLALRNFAVGTVLSKTEVIQAAVFGAIFFSAGISLLGWFAALWLRQASLSLEYSFIENAALTLVFTVLVQSCLCLCYVISAISYCHN